MAASGNSALRPQIGVTDVESFIDTHDTDLTGGTGATTVSSIPGANGTWTNFIAGGATSDSAFADAGFLLAKVEFSAGTQTDIRLVAFTTT